MSILRSHGLKGLYRGMTSTILRDIMVGARCSHAGRPVMCKAPEQWSVPVCTVARDQCFWEACLHTKPPHPNPLTRATCIWTPIHLGVSCCAGLRLVLLRLRGNHPRYCGPRQDQGRPLIRPGAPPAACNGTACRAARSSLAGGPTNCKALPGVACSIRGWVCGARRCAQHRAMHCGPPLVQVMLAGVMAGFGLWGSMFPIDTIKSKMQVGREAGRGRGRAEARERSAVLVGAGTLLAHPPSPHR